MEEIVEVLGARRIDHLTFTEKTSAIDIGKNSELKRESRMMLLYGILF